MNFKKYIWPATTFLLLLCLAVLSRAYYQASIRRPSDPVARDFIGPAQSCYQNLDPSGWQVIEGSVVTFPRCLSVMNARFGSRFNFDFLNGGQTFNSSVLGNLEDRNSGFSLFIDGQPLIPATINTDYVQSVSIGFTFQKIHFSGPQKNVTLTITSPFSPSQSFNDPNLKLSAAPFFYLDIAVESKSEKTQTTDVQLSWSNLATSKENSDHFRLYYDDPVRKDAALATTFSQSPHLSIIDWRYSKAYSWDDELPPHQTKTLSGIYAGYASGGVITNSHQPEAFEPLPFAYTQWFNSVDAVIDYALENKSKILTLTNQFESTTKTKFSSPQEYWLAAQAFHSYQGNTWLLHSQRDRDVKFLTWEGEFKYINTVDVAHDYAVIEGLYFPWTLKSSLELWQNSAAKDNYGVVIPHDIGKRHDLYMRQTYGTSDMFPSAMPVEENANYLLLTYWYWHQTLDLEFIRHRADFLYDIFTSLKARDTNNNGLPDVVGITTYDNDGNLALLKGSDNVYLGIKQFSGYLFLSQLYQQLGQTDRSNQVYQAAQTILTTLSDYYQTHNSLPISLESSDDTSPNIVTGLYYPALTKFNSPLLDQLTDILEKVYPDYRQQTLFYDSQNNLLGRKLAKHQSINLGWISHNLISDYVANRLLNTNYATPDYAFTQLYDNPYSYADGHLMKTNNYPPNTPLVFYPRGVAIFANTVK